MSGLSAELSLQNHVPKIPFDILMYFFPDLLPPPSHGPAATVLWAQLERNRFLQQHPRHWYGWVLTHHSLFPLKQSLLLPGSPAPCSVALLGWMVVVVVLVLLSSFFLCYVQFFSQWYTGMSPWGGWTSTVSLSSVLSVQDSYLQFFFLTDESGWGRFSALLVPQSILRSVWLLPDIHMDKTPPRSLGVWC